MCTVLLSYRTHPVAPIVLAANRDEFFARPTQGPQLLREAPFRTIGGRDVTHGGSWLGVNNQGFFAALTNMRALPDQRRSRGELVVESLAARSAGEGSEILRSLIAAAPYRPFSMLYGTEDGVHFAKLRGDQLTITAVEPGNHVLVSNAGLNSQGPGARRSAELLAQTLAATDREALLEGLKGALADHATPAELPANLLGTDLGPEFESRLQALCVHTPHYGTRSSNVVLVGDSCEFWACEGSPCTGTWSRHDALLGASRE